MRAISKTNPFEDAITAKVGASRLSCATALKPKLVGSEPVVPMPALKRTKRHSVVGSQRRQSTQSRHSAIPK